jgi:hypothetical protein
LTYTKSTGSRKAPTKRKAVKMKMFSDVRIGESIETPRFLEVTISAIFENAEDCEMAGFRTSTDYKNGANFDIFGKNIGDYRMRFAACYNPKGNMYK